MAKEPVLAVFDIDGTLAHLGPRRDSAEWDDQYLLGLPSYANMLNTVREYLKLRHVTVMFCTGRPVRWQSTTRRWLESKFDLARSGAKTTLVCRPDATPESGIPTFKLREILQAIRRLGSNPAEALIFDDDVHNLRLFETLKPMVRKLSVFKVDDGVISSWSL